MYVREFDFANWDNSYTNNMYICKICKNIYELYMTVGVYYYKEIKQMHESLKQINQM